MLSHTFGTSTTTVQPTCLLPGESRRSCTRASCGHIDIGAIAALGHNWGPWVVTVQPTTTSEGRRVRTCQRDPSHTEPEILMPLPIHTSISVGDRVIPGDVDDEALVAPVRALSNQLTAGPNPVGRSSGGVSFFWQGSAVDGGVLMIYDMLGNAVNTIRVSENESLISGSRRVIGTWDLTDGNGRTVSVGTYLVRGAVVSGGKREVVSVVVGVW